MQGNEQMSSSEADSLTPRERASRLLRRQSIITRNFDRDPSLWLADFNTAYESWRSDFLDSLAQDAVTQEKYNEIRGRHAVLVGYVNEVVARPEAAQNVSFQDAQNYLVSQEFRRSLRLLYVLSNASAKKEKALDAKEKAAAGEIELPKLIQELVDAVASANNQVAKITASGLESIADRNVLGQMKQLSIRLRSDLQALQRNVAFTRSFLEKLNQPGMRFEDIEKSILAQEILSETLNDYSRLLASLGDLEQRIDVRSAQAILETLSQEFPEFDPNAGDSFGNLLLKLEKADFTTYGIKAVASDTTKFNQKINLAKRSLRPILNLDQNDPRRIRTLNAAAAIFQRAEAVLAKLSQHEADIRAGSGSVVAEQAPGMKPEEVRHSNAFRDVAVYKNWIPANSPEKITDKNTQNLIITKIIDFVMGGASQDYWARATDPTVGHIKVINWPAVPRGSDSVLVNDVLQSFPGSDEVKNAFEEQLTIVSELISGGSEWGTIAKTASFEQIREYSLKYVPDERMLQAVGEMKSLEQLENPEALSTGQLIFEAMTLYGAWGESFIELSEAEHVAIYNQAKNEVANGAIAMPTIDDLKILAKAAGSTTSVDTSRYHASLQDTKYLIMFWNDSSHENGKELNDTDRYERFKELVVSLVAYSRARHQERDVNHARYGIWPLELVDDKKRERFRTEVAKSVGVLKLSGGKHQYIIKVDPGKDFAGEITDGNGNIITQFEDPDGRSISKAEYLQLALNAGKAPELLGYEMAVAFMEPMIQDYTGTQGNKGSRIFDTYTYRRRKETSGSEGQFLEGLFHVRRLMMPPLKLFSAKLPSGVLNRDGGSQLQRVLMVPEYTDLVLLNEGFSPVGTREGAGQRIKFMDAMNHVEQIYKSLSLGFTGIGIDLFKISHIDRKGVGIFSAASQLIIDDGVLIGLTGFVESTLKYWIADHIRKAGELKDGFDSRVWVKYGNEITPLLDYFFTFSEEKKKIILERAKTITLERILIIEMLKMIITESLMRKKVSEISNEDAAGIIYAFTGVSLSQYPVKTDVGGNITQVMKMDVDDVAYCFQQAGVNVAAPFWQAFRRGGGVV